MNDDASSDMSDLISLLKDLKGQHRLLDTEIIALRETGAIDMINIARMKKQKLALKDKIARIENTLTPDIIA